MSRRPTRAMLAKAERDLRTAHVARDRARDSALDTTPHRHDEPVGAILDRADAALKAAYDGACAEVDALKGRAVERGLAVWDRGSFRWST